MLKGFVSSIGLLLFGLLLVWVAPSLVKSVRGAMDKTLPEQTSPYNETHGKTGDNSSGILENRTDDRP